MSEFEDKLIKLVVAFASQMVELAAQTTRDMIDQAFETRDRDRNRARTRKRSASEDVADLLGLRSRGRRPKLAPALREFERRYIAHALAKHHGNITHAATALGIQRQVLQRKIRRLKVKNV